MSCIVTVLPFSIWESKKYVVLFYLAALLVSMGIHIMRLVFFTYNSSEMIALNVFFSVMYVFACFPIRCDTCQVVDCLVLEHGTTIWKENRNPVSSWS